MSRGEQEKKKDLRQLRIRVFENLAVDYTVEVQVARDNGKQEEQSGKKK